MVEAICHAPQSDDLIVEYPSLNSEEASTARLQVNFGCPAFCTFCFEGYDRKPYREVSLDQILAAADRLKVAQGVEAVDVYSFNFNTHEQILALMLELNQELGTTFLFSTHDPAVIRRARRVVRLLDGRVDGTEEKG